MKRYLATALGGLALASLAGSASAQSPYPMPNYPAMQAPYMQQPMAYPPIQYVSYAPMNPYMAPQPMAAMAQPIYVPVYVPVVQQPQPMFGPVETLTQDGPLSGPSPKSDIVKTSATVDHKSGSTAVATMAGTTQVASTTDAHPTEPTWSRKVYTFFFGAPAKK